MTSGRVERGLEAFIYNHPYKLTNTYVYDWESDVFSVTKTGYAYEIEIKVSYSDFKADFNKRHKHQVLSCKKDWMCLNLNYTGGLYPGCDIKLVPITGNTCPNKFFYACPEGLIDVKEIPEYAGLIYTDGYYHKVIKPAPFLHKDKMDVKKKLFDKYYWAYTNLLRTINQEK